MAPTTTNTRRDQFLTNISLAYTNEEYIADKILPAVPNLAEYTGDIAVKGSDHLRVYETAKRATWDETQHRITYDVGTALSYRIDDYDLAEYVADKTRRLYQKPFDADQDALMQLEEARLLLIEDALATALANASVLTNTATPSNLWSDAVNSDPLSDIMTWCEAFRLKAGRWPNYAWTNMPVVSKLAIHPNFTGRVNGVRDTLSRQAVLDIIKAEVGLKDIFVGSAIKVTSKEGQTVTKGEVWQDDFGLYYAPASASLNTPSFGYRFEISGKNKWVNKRREPVGDKGDIVELGWARQDKILDINCAYLGDQVIT